MNQENPFEKLRIQSEKLKNQLSELEKEKRKIDEEERELRRQEVERHRQEAIALMSKSFNHKPIFVIVRRPAWNDSGARGIVSYELDEQTAKEMANQMEFADEHNLHVAEMEIDFDYDMDSPAYLDKTYYDVVRLHPQEIVTHLDDKKYKFFRLD